MVRVLADGKTKFTILTTAPSDPTAPTPAELNAGIDLSCKVMATGFQFGPTASEKISEPALCDEIKSNALGQGNWVIAFTLWRYYLAAGGIDVTADEGFAAVKDKGTTLYGYTRQNDKPATTDWATGDEIQYGAEFITDTPQSPERTGFTKYIINGECQRELVTFGTL